MGAGILSLTGLLTGFVFGQRSVNITWNLPSAIDVSYPLSLATGDNIVNVPSGASVVNIEMPPNNTTSVLFKTSAGDVGWPMHSQLPFGPVSIGTLATQFILNAPSPLPGPVQISFI